ncbi:MULTISPECIES: biotin transporter BioY [unclassified Bosea (in: a-proteobacteria)]|uniref:biotin transporter BioY n=1 Tax=unclassified Bosea (in: a-proteobacteria) TaxID=2653178 RepID=UPI000F75C069|nr:MULTISPECIES: biotin transporter BioY [unclassified Bosea (in: a-proteobacteria)]AZO78489.1 biotin transporter BioY [Bosea sp. Tri-49]RXT20018.1 biotin transporter BioY [Bosea sp. Tri-39]RXT36890.1 biotin transporter BioY [Bosea sp. Tri-54]
MSDLSYAAPARFSPLDLQARPAFVQLGAVVLGTLVLAIASQISVPMVSVPMTMQTLAVILIGALYGWRLGALTILAWLGEAALGLPVLASGKAGLAPFMGPTSGYLFSFPLVAALVGLLAERGWNGSRPAFAFASMLLGHALCLLLGGLWLATLIGAEKAVLAGVVPFLLGSLVKSGLGAAILMALVRRTNKAEQA